MDSPKATERVIRGVMERSKNGKLPEHARERIAQALDEAAEATAIRYISGSRPQRKASNRYTARPF